MKTFFKKSKKPFLGHFWPFCPNLGKNYLTSKKREFFCQFLNIPIIYHSAKNQKKLMNHYWENHWTDGPTDRPTDGQADSGDFIEPSVGRGSNINQNISKTMDLLRRFQPVLPRSSLRTIYKTSIRSQLDYADVIYDQAYNSSFLQKQLNI